MTLSSSVSMQLVEKLTTIAEECQSAQFKKLRDICEKYDRLHIHPACQRPHTDMNRAFVLYFWSSLSVLLSKEKRRTLRRKWTRSGRRRSTKPSPKTRTWQRSKCRPLNERNPVAVCWFGHQRSLSTTDLPPLAAALGLTDFFCPQREAGDQQIVCQWGGAVHQTGKQWTFSDHHFISQCLKTSVLFQTFASTLCVYSWKMHRVNGRRDSRRSIRISDSRFWMKGRR